MEICTYRSHHDGILLYVYWSSCPTKPNQSRIFKTFCKVILNETLPSFAEQFSNSSSNEWECVMIGLATNSNKQKPVEVFHFGIRSNEKWNIDAISLKFDLIKGLFCAKININSQHGVRRKGLISGQHRRCRTSIFCTHQSAKNRDQAKNRMAPTVRAS